MLVSAEALLHRIHLSRGRAVITELLGDQRPRCWVSDRWRWQFIAFITDRDVPATNKAPERTLSPSDIHRRVTKDVPSLWGADVHALIRSFIGTERLHGHRPHQATSSALAGKLLFADRPTP